MEKDVQEQLLELNHSLERAKTLHAWKQLKDSEGVPRLPPAFQMYDPVKKDLSIEVSYFIARTMDLHEILNRHKGEWTIVAKNTLTAMEREMAVIRESRSG